MIASGGLSGGISSSIAGGSFWKGVREGLITAGLNHVAHMVKDAFSQQNEPKIKITVTDQEVGTTEFTSQGKTYETPLYKMIVEGEDVNGNLIKEEFAVSRFGVKNGKVQALEAPAPARILSCGFKFFFIFAL